jgi:hypothetical protein
MRRTLGSRDVGNMSSWDPTMCTSRTRLGGGESARRLDRSAWAIPRASRWTGDLAADFNLLRFPSKDSRFLHSPLPPGQLVSH